jgi:hypothetical protein
MADLLSLFDLFLFFDPKIIVSNGTGLIDMFGFFAVNVAVASVAPVRAGSSVLASASSGGHLGYGTSY